MDKELRPIKEVLASSQVDKLIKTPRSSGNKARASEPEEEVCPACKGAGYVHPRLPDGKIDHTRIVPCTKCIDPELTGANPKHTFKNFKRIKGTEDALKAFKALAEGKTELHFLLCYGGVGNGKTHLIEALLLRWFERGIYCRYQRVPDMLLNIKLGMDKENKINTTQDRIRSYSTMPYLVLDDLGLEYGTAWEHSILENIIDNRYRAGLITVMCTNKSLEQLSEEADLKRLVSRFCDPDVSQLVLNSAPDYRMRSA